MHSMNSLNQSDLCNEDYIYEPKMFSSATYSNWLFKVNKNFKFK